MKAQNLGYNRCWTWFLGKGLRFLGWCSVLKRGNQKHKEWKTAFGLFVGGLWQIFVGQAVLGLICLREVWGLEKFFPVMY